MSNLIHKIKTKQLPLTEQELSYIKDKNQHNELIQVIGKIDERLRTDWKNKQINLIDRATKNITISSELWRMLLEKECEININRYLNSIFYNPLKITYVIMIWRGALAFIPIINEKRDLNNFVPIHTRFKRNEHDLSINIIMPISDLEKKCLFLNKDVNILIPDVMLGTGNSISILINQLKNLKIKTENITVSSIVASPEGIYRLFDEFTDIHLITNVIDSQLNQDGYIIGDGLGDAGDKYFYKNSINNFKSYKYCFSNEQWQYLEKIINKN